MNYYLSSLKKYATFSGRAQRSEYWYFSLFSSIIIVALVITGSSILYKGYFLATLVPSLAVSIRRLHDVDKSGWMMLVSLVPIIGPFWLIILLSMKGNPGVNEYGMNPKETHEVPVPQPE